MIERFGGCFPVAPVYVICCTNPQVTVEQNQYNPGKTAYDRQNRKTEKERQDRLSLFLMYKLNKEIFYYVWNYWIYRQITGS